MGECINNSCTIISPLKQQNDLEHAIKQPTNRTKNEHTTNDKGETIHAIGAPGSLERVKTEHPALIERLNSLFYQEARIDVAIETIREAGIRSEMETSNLLAASHYGDRPDIVRSLVYTVTRTGLRQFCDTYKQELTKAYIQFPAEYSFPATELPNVVERMNKAIEKGTFNKNGRAFKATCQVLNVPHTYKAIAAFIAQ